MGFDNCLHDVVYKIGIQKDSTGKELFTLANCIMCESTISFKLHNNYECIPAEYFDLKKYASNHLEKMVICPMYKRKKETRRQND